MFDFVLFCGQIDSVFLLFSLFLEPCTVNKELMNEHKIGFAFAKKNKVYLSHRDHITFRCNSGKRLVGNMSMRVQCNDGEITLPTLMFSVSLIKTSNQNYLYLTHYSKEVCTSIHC